MKLSSFEEIIRLQFNAYMMKGIVRYRRKQCTKRLERETLFCEIIEIRQNIQSNYDSYTFEFSVFQVWNTQSRYLMKNWVQFYACYLKSNVATSCCTIFKICGTERLRSFNMYHVLL